MTGRKKGIKRNKCLIDYCKTLNISLSKFDAELFNTAFNMGWKYGKLRYMELKNKEKEEETKQNTTANSEGKK